MCVREGSQAQAYMCILKMRGKGLYLSQGKDTDFENVQEGRKDAKDSRWGSILSSAGCGCGQCSVTHTYLQSVDPSS